VDLDLQKLRDAFLAESEENLTTMEQALVALEGSPDDPELVHTIFRMVHTLKGGASIVGFTPVGHFAHELEDLLDRVREGSVPVTPTLVTVLLRSVDALRTLLEAAVAGREEIEPACASLLEQVERLGDDLGSGQEDAVAAGPGPSTKAAVADPDGERRSGPGRRLADVMGEARKGGTLRVAIDKLDRLLNLTGELAVNRGRMGLLLEAGSAADLDACREVSREADRLFTELQQTVMQARMVPLGPLFQHQRRLVRDQAAALGKVARLVIEGGEVEVDTRIVEHLQDPLMHLVRNALDHGLESPQARRSLDKDPCGTISLTAAHEGGKIVLRVADDGAGIDLERVEAQARDRGLVAGTAKPGEADLLRVILEPGFTTADEVTELSGRGVGLDVVRRNIEALRGTLAVASAPGAGTTFTIRLPLTLAIIAGFGVQSEGETYIVPLDCVMECLELPAGASLVRGYGMVMLRERPLPLIRLRDQFGLGGPGAPREHVLVVQHEGLRVGLVVDQLLGARQAVIKPFGRFLQRVPGLVGSAIEGDGRVALILDVAEIVPKAIATQHAVDPDRTADGTPAPESQPGAGLTMNSRN
jgi:two-component system chemotaxis sensor kinase CheA